MQGLRRAGVLGEHLDAAAQPTDEVAGGEEALHLSDRQLDLRVAESTAHMAAGDDLERAGIGVDQDEDAAGGGHEGAVQADGVGAGVALRMPHEDGELDPRQPLGLPDRLIESDLVVRAEPSAQAGVGALTSGQAPPASTSADSGPFSSAVPVRGPPNHWFSTGGCPGAIRSPRTSDGR